MQRHPLVAWGTARLQVLLIKYTVLTLDFHYTAPSYMLKNKTTVLKTPACMAWLLKAAVKASTPKRFYCVKKKWIDKYSFKSSVNAWTVRGFISQTVKVPVDKRNGMYRVRDIVNILKTFYGISNKATVYQVSSKGPSTWWGQAASTNPTQWYAVCITYVRLNDFIMTHRLV